MAVRLRFTPRSLANLIEIRAYIARRRPHTAELVRGRIIQTIDLLRSSPRLGHIGRREGTRELVVAGLPYIVVYRLQRRDEDQLVILRIVHDAQDRRR